MDAINTIIFSIAFLLLHHSSGHPLLYDDDTGFQDDNDVIYDPVDDDSDPRVENDASRMDDEQIAREVGIRVAAWKNDSDINPEELGLYAEGDIVSSNPNSRNGLTDERTRWPGGVVPYEIAGRFNSRDLATIQGAMEEYHKRTCIKFVPRNSNHRDYISIVSDNTGCWSSVGRVGGAQKVNLQSPGCLTTLGTPIHELMHAVGFLHEQNRYERDKHVKIMWKNIQPGRENNFEKAKKGQTYGQGIDYDYRSVMHYSSGAFSKNGQSTIVPLISDMEIGQRKGFSRGDVQKIRHMYKCPQRRPGLRRR